MFRYRPSFHKPGSQAPGIPVGIRNDGSHYIFPFSEAGSHSLVIGRTGSGKSSLLHDLVRGLLESGKNVVLLDPHGSLCKQVIGNCKKSDLVYFSTSETESGRIVKLNPLAVSRMEDAIVVSGVLKDLLQEDRDLSMETWGPRLQVIIGSLLPSLLYEGRVSSLNEFCMLLMDRKAMESAITGLHNREIASFIYSSMIDQRVWRDYVSSTINKLIGIISSISLTRVIGEEDSFDLKSVLSGRSKLIVLDFSKAETSGSSIRAASTLILARIWIAALQSGINETCIVIDEAQEFSGSLMDNFLNEGRKFGISLILASQSLKFFDEKTSGALLANVGNIFSFQLSREDSHIVSGIFPQSARIRIEDALISMQPHECLHINRDRILDAIPGFKTCRINPVNEESVSELIEKSRGTYGTVKDQKKQFISRGIDTHQMLTERVRAFLGRLGLMELQVFSIEGSRPDCIFTDSASVFLCEIEISDMMHPERIMKKLISYRGKKKLFFTENGDCSSLYEMILGFFEKHKFNVDFENISIIERRNTRFYLYDGAKLRLPDPLLFRRGSFFQKYSVEQIQPLCQLISLLWNAGKAEINTEDIASMGNGNSTGIMELVKDLGGTVTLRKLLFIE